MQGEPTQKQKQVPQNLRLKLNTLIKSIRSSKYSTGVSNNNGNVIDNMIGKVEWVDDNTILISESPQVIAHIGSMFDMSFKTFVKFVEIVGCKVNKVDSEKYHGIQSDIYSITLPEEPKEEAPETSILKQLLQHPQPKDQKPCLYETSIEANMQQESELYSIEYENELKDMFMNKFKININETNEFIYKILYKILINKENKKISPCEILELLAEVRDRVFESQKEVEECISNFKEKIKSFGDNKDEKYGSEVKSEPKMVNEQEENVGFQPINFGTKNNL